MAPRIHWLGTGLSSLPGLRRLIAAGFAPYVYDRDTDKARAMVADLLDKTPLAKGGARAAATVFAGDALPGALRPGDVVISMVPADLHPGVAETCLQAGAHFVSTSYISPAMRALDGRARAAGLCLLNEMGLDPGIDHMMAHDLVAAYRAGGDHQPGDSLSFQSFCGGVPRQANDFRYKFSWSPLGVLRALGAPARYLRDGAPVDIAQPWQALAPYVAPLAQPESFEVYPNRDSLPFIAEYGFDPAWQVRDFQRGTLRLPGWAAAWQPIFAEITALADQPPGQAAARLADLSQDLWRAHPYGADEADRVVLVVSLKAERAGQCHWHQSWALDAWGDARGSAMARLVSVPVSLGAEAILRGAIAPGVQATPGAPALLQPWLQTLGAEAQWLRRIDHLA